MDNTCKKVSWSSFFLAVLSGIVTAISFPGFVTFLQAKPYIKPPMYCHGLPLTFFCLVPLFFALKGKRLRSAFALAFTSGFVFYLILVHWMGALVYWGGAPGLVGYVGLSAVMALYWGLFGVLALVVIKRTRFPDWLTIPCLWVLMEYGHSNFPIGGFCWGNLGYSQAEDQNLIQWASIGGVYIVSFFMAVFNVLFYRAVSGARKLSVKALLRPVAAIACLIFVLQIIGGMLRKEQDDPPQEEMNVSILQHGYTPMMKWTLTDYRQTMLDMHTYLSKKGTPDDVDLIVWPEASLPGHLMESGFSKFKKAAESVASEKNTYLLTGSLAYVEEELLDEEQKKGKNRDRPSYNSAFLFGREGEFVDRYDKHHLAPFGEYVPFSEHLPFLRSLTLVPNDMKPGVAGKVLDTDKARIGTLICFESTDPKMARDQVNKGAQLLVTISNLGWFGASGCPIQELAISRFRAVENRAPVAKSGELGITCFIDAWGRPFTGDVFRRYGGSKGAGKRAPLQLYQRGICSADLDISKRSSIYKTCGDWIIYAAAGLLFISVIVGRKKAPQSLL
ncbi:apolipoprotein N-acyltransferase [Candidatus Hydrogenedentota bacterium]